MGAAITDSGRTTQTPTPPRARPTVRFDAAVRAAVGQGLLSESRPVAGFVDTDGVRSSVTELREAFGHSPGVLHTFAAKASSLIPVLRLLAECGMGCEVASPGELRLAVEAGFAPGTIVLDSPAKTREEIRLALALGVAVNADSIDELRRIDALRNRDSASVLGLRVNPQVGGGAIGPMSTATDTSKFGVALRDPGAREEVVRAFEARPWLTRLHAHVGSQGCPLELIAAGVAQTYELAEEINERLGTRQVTSLDIGGGLPVNFSDDTVHPTYTAYVDALTAAAPALFSGRYTLVTEFGRSLLAKNGFIGARVEYTKDAGDRRIALTHAGAQTATRTVFMPDSWPLRVGAFTEDGSPKQGPELAQDIAGPCCFAGDVVAHGRKLPELAEGDFVVLYDTGAYYFSTPWAYNSLPRPAVYGFRSTAPEGEVKFATVREAQTMDAIAAESGLAHADALTGLG
ncbi:diaminopimelate decarboxylase [Streptomyces sp. ISL-111]|uniref:diaminopimelate decarboxylase n=1 Tax=Streptomyces sp. ISL-111 TaxID=2819175 RepID=UPI001BE81689|nr:diaminopimelate decarboxylase [Streptomyces sp. ISL-111]MBT2377645.1 diaminopimelate decarboxylase [Streptomyces sp. ISL-111]